MDKVANLMANHNGTPAAVASLYDEKISEVETFFVDSDTLTAIYFDTDTGIVDKCTHEYDWQYVTSSSDTVIENVVTDTSVSGYSLSFDSADKARAYLAFSYNDTYTSGRLKTIEGIFFVDTSTSASATSVLFSYAGYSYWLFNGGNGKSNFVYYLSCSYSESSASLNYSFMGTSATVAIPLSTFDEPFHVAYSADFINKKAYIFLNGSSLATINDKIISSGRTGSTNYYFMSTYILRLIALGCMCTASIPSGVTNPRNYSYGITTADTLNGRCLEFRVSLSTKYTEDFTPYKSTVFAPNLPVKGNLCVQALTPYAQNTKILMHFDDPDNPFKDECNFYPMYKVAGTTSLTETNAKFGTALNFDGSTYFRTNGKVSFGGKDFTIDCWARARVGGYNGAAPIWQLANSASQRIQLAADKSASYMGFYNLWGSFNGNASINFGNDGKTHHFAVSYVHETGTWYAFVDGILQGTSTWQISRLSAYLFLGYNNQGYVKLVGQICEFRFVDGQALWTENFTPPDKPYFLTKTLYAPLVMEKSPTADAQTKALLHFDDPNNPLKDECGNQWTVGVTTDSFISTDSWKFGTYLCANKNLTSGSTLKVLAACKLYLGGQDFTADFWGKGAFNLRLSRFVIRSTYFEYYYSSNSYRSQKIFSGVSNSWRHYALVYNWAAKQLKLYENGILKDSYTCTYQSRRVFVLTYAATNTAYPPRVDEFRVVDGVAIWTSNFTPPTEPYSLNTVNTKQPPCIGVRNQGNNFLYREVKLCGNTNNFGGSHGLRYWHCQLACLQTSKTRSSP